MIERLLRHMAAGHALNEVQEDTSEMSSWAKALAEPGHSDRIQASMHSFLPALTGLWACFATKCQS